VPTLERLKAVGGTQKQGRKVRTSTYGKNSFKYAAAVLWNYLPDDFRKISNFNQFKNILNLGNCQGSG
jgi:hypothetical protein